MRYINSIHSINNNPSSLKNMVNPIREQQSTPNINNGSNNARQTFKVFFDRWLIDQERYLQDLIELIHLNNGGGDQDYEDRCKEMISQVMDHYGWYFDEKERMIRENVFIVLTPTWFSSSERRYLWLGGYRPGLAFRLVFNNVNDLSKDQSLRIERLMSEVKEQEKSLTNDSLESKNQWYASPSIIGLLRQLGCTRNGAQHGMELAIDRLEECMEALVNGADFLRRKIGVKLIEILKPAQAVRFLAAVAQLQLRLRRWGMQRDAQYYKQSPMHSGFENQHRPV